MALLNQSIMGEAARGDSQSHKKRKLDHRAMGEQTERLAASNGATCAADTGHGPSGDADPKQRVLKLLEPFSREQLLEILTTAATQHEDVLHAIKASASVDVAHRKIFVRGLAWETTTEGLTEAFEAFGQVEEAAVIYDKASGKSRGYGFVTFVEMDGAQRAIETQAIEIDGRRATCNLAAVRAQSDDHAHHQHYQHQQPHYGGAAASNQYSNHVAHGHQPTHAMGHAAPVRQGTHMAPPAAAAPYTVYTTTMPPPAAVYAVPAVAPPAIVMEPPRTQNDEADRKLFVRGLSWDTTDESLRGEFIKYGELSEASVVRERKTGKSKGFGFVTFRHRGAAAAALQQPHKVIDGRSVTCNLASLGRTTPHGGGSSASYMAPPPTAYAPPPQQQPDMGGYTMYAQPPAAVDPYHQHPQYAYGGAPPPLPPTQQYYYPPAPQSHPGQQSRR